jgi:hypothetical protein
MDTVEAPAIPWSRQGFHYLSKSKLPLDKTRILSYTGEALDIISNIASP